MSPRSEQKNRVFTAKKGLKEYLPVLTTKDRTPYTKIWIIMNYTLGSTIN
jgi:hypothetical protein